MTKILIVEDEDSVLDPLELLLSKEGFSIETARNGREGLDKFWKVSPDLVLQHYLMQNLIYLKISQLPLLETQQMQMLMLKLAK